MMPRSSRTIERLAIIRGRIEAIRGRHVFRNAEGSVLLNEAAATILSLCDGTRSCDEIINSFVALHRGTPDHAQEFLEIALARGWIGPLNSAPHPSARPQRVRARLDSNA